LNQFPQFNTNSGFKSSRIGDQIDAIYERLVKTFENPPPSDDPGVSATIGFALEALQLISHLYEDKLALKSYNLFHTIMDAPIPEIHSHKKWEASCLTISGAYKGGKPIPQVEDHQDNYTQHVLTFLNHHFELATGDDGQDQDIPIQNALYALVLTSNPLLPVSLKSFDSTKSLFVRGIQYAIQGDRLPSLRKTTLLFLPLICDQWFNANSPIMNSKQMRSFCIGWASAVDSVDLEQAPAIKMAALTVLLEMINSPHWCPHVVPEKLALLKDLKLVPDGFQPLQNCINNPNVIDTIRDAENPMAIVYWVTTLWSKYAELKPKVQEQLKTTTKEIMKNEQTPGSDVSRSPIGKCLLDMTLELRKVKDELRQYPTWPPNPAAAPLEKKAKDLGLAVGALNTIRRG